MAAAARPLRRAGIAVLAACLLALVARACLQLEPSRPIEDGVPAPGGMVRP